MNFLYKDREDAGFQLAAMLKKYSGNKNAMVIAIPRGGVVIGYVVAKALHLPLEIEMVKKIGHPDNPELAIGAVSLQGSIIHERYGVDSGYVQMETGRIQKLLDERYKQYGRKPANVRNKIIIIVDDGIATGNTLLAAVDLIKKGGPEKIIVAVPVGPLETLQYISEKADEVICPETPDHFYAIGQFYENFEQVEDAEVIRLLKSIS